MAGTDPLDTRGQGLGNDRHLTIFDHRPHLRVPRQGSGRRSRAAEREAVERMLEDVARLQAVRLQQSRRLGIGVDPTTQRDDPAPCGSVRGSRVDGCRDRRRQQDRHDRDNAESTHRQRPSYCPAGDRATSLWATYARVNTADDRGVDSERRELAGLVRRRRMGSERRSMPREWPARFVHTDQSLDGRGRARRSGAPDARLPGPRAPHPRLLERDRRVGGVTGSAPADSSGASLVRCTEGNGTGR